MKRKILTGILVAAMAVTAVGCGTTSSSSTSTAESSAAESSAAESTSAEESSAASEAASAAEAAASSVVATEGSCNVVMCLADASDYYIGTMVGAKVQEAFESAGAEVQVLDGANDVQNQLNQMQNAITSGADIIYLFTAGDGEVYVDVLNEAKEAGVKTLVSGTDPGEGVATSYDGTDEFQVGVMAAEMMNRWIDATYPDAKAGEIGVLMLEASSNQNMIKRCMGMRMIGEKFLRQVDMSTMYFVKEDGDPVNYIDENGKEVAVDEPTGGLILDENGNAQLNPYYNEKVEILEYANRNSTGYDSTEAQNAIESTITQGVTNLKIVMSYGDTGAAISAKTKEMIEDGRINATVDQFACFCSDLTDTNKELILSSAKDESLLRGIMGSGDSIATVCDRAIKMVKGEEVEAYTFEPLSNVVSNDDGTDVVTTYYTDCPQLPDTTEFFPE